MNKYTPSSTPPDVPLHLPVQCHHAHRGVGDDRLCRGAGARSRARAPECLVCVAEPAGRRADGWPRTTPSRRARAPPADSPYPPLASPFQIFFSVYELAVDTILLSFCEDAEGNGGHPRFAPPLLMSAVSGGGAVQIEADGGQGGAKKRGAR